MRKYRLFYPENYIIPRSSITTLNDTLVRFFSLNDGPVFVNNYNLSNLAYVILIPINCRIPYLIRKSTVYLSLLAVLCTLYACPFSSAYTLDDEPQQAINEEYLGNWATTLAGPFNRQYPVRMSLEKYTDSLYWLVFTSYMRDLARYRVAVHDSIRGTAFMSDVNGHTVINYQAAGQNFIGEFIYENGKLSIYPFEERFTNKILRKNADLRLMLEWHYASRLNPFYDETFTLKNMVRVK